MGPHPEATVAGWEQARLHAMGDFWDQWISASISVWLRGSSFWSEHDFWPRSLFGSIYGRHVATAKSNPRLEFSVCIQYPSEPHQPVGFITLYLIQLWVMLMYWLLHELTALNIHLFCRTSIVIKWQSRTFFASCGSFAVTVASTSPLQLNILTNMVIRICTIFPPAYTHCSSTGSHTLSHCHPEPASLTACAQFLPEIKTVVQLSVSANGFTVSRAVGATGVQVV